MTLFQILALIVVGCLFVVTVIAMLTGRVARRDGILWSIAWLAAGAAITWPGVTAVVARVLGIGRGTDLVMYCAVVMMLVGFLMVYVRLRRLQRDMTLLVRHLAIREAVPGDDAVGPPAAPGEQTTNGPKDTESVE